MSPTDIKNEMYFFNIYSLNWTSVGVIKLMMNNLTKFENILIIGSYVSACVHFSSMFGVPCTGNSYHAGLTDDNHIHKLQVAADATISKVLSWERGEKL